MNPHRSSSILAGTAALALLTLPMGKGERAPGFVVVTSSLICFTDKSPTVVQADYAALRADEPDAGAYGFTQAQADRVCR